MSKTSNALQTEVKHCWAYGKFAVELLEQVSKDYSLDFEAVWSKYFPDVSHQKALKNGRNFIKNCDPRKAIQAARNAYQYYLTEQSEKIQQEGKTFDITVHGKEIGAAWKKLNETQREKYKKQAAEDEARHAMDLQDVEEKIRNGAMQESPFHRNTRHRTGNVSALNMYVSHMTTILKNSEPDLSNTDRMKKIHHMWKSASAEEQATYQAKADEKNRSHVSEEGSATVATSTTATPAVEKKAKSSPKPKQKSATVTPAPAAEQSAPAPSKKSSPKPTQKPSPKPKGEKKEVEATTATPAPVEKKAKASPKPKVATKA